MKWKFKVFIYLNVLLSERSGEYFSANAEATHNCESVVQCRSIRLGSYDVSYLYHITESFKFGCGKIERCANFETSIALKKWISIIQS